MSALLHYLPIIGQVLIGFYFTFFGVWNIYHWKPTIDVMLADKIPLPVFLMSIGVSCQIILGVMIMCNAQVKITALLLILFTLFSVFMFHPFWKYKGDKQKYHLSKFIDNLTVTLGGLLLLISNITPISNISELISN
jgi:putative oxidoreductase